MSMMQAAPPPQRGLKVLEEFFARFPTTKRPTKGRGLVWRSWSMSDDEESEWGPLKPMGFVFSQSWFFALQMTLEWSPWT